MDSETSTEQLDPEPTGITAAAFMRLHPDEIQDLLERHIEQDLNAHFISSDGEGHLPITDLTFSSICRGRHHDTFVIVSRYTCTTTVALLSEAYHFQRGISPSNTNPLQRLIRKIQVLLYLISRQRATFK